MTVRAVVPDEYPRLVEIWRSAVDATHDFLRSADRDEIERRLIPDYFPHVDLVAIDIGGRLVGFAGTAQDRLEMLFVDAAHHGEGVGSALLDYAVGTVGVRHVDVNEANGSATAFYRARGFDVVARSDVDDEGRAYPLLRMDRVAAPDSSAITDD